MLSNIQNELRNKIENLSKREFFFTVQAYVLGT